MSNDHLRKRLAELDEVPLDSIVSPVLTLPLDVILEIFGDCNSSSPDKIYPYWSPTVLLRICRERYGGQWNGQGVRRYLDYRATLAHGRPLSVNLCGTLVKSLGFVEFSALLRRFAPRLQSLKLEVETMALVKLNRNPPSFPLLQKLAVILYNANDDDSEEDDNDDLGPLEHLFVDVPRLQEVFTRSGRVAPRMEFPWTQLTKFEGECVPTLECWHIMGRAENLIECTLSLIDDRTPLQDLDPLYHLHLQSLTLRGLRSPNAEGYPSSFLPDVDHILSFLSRHSGQLRMFSFSRCTVNVITVDCLRRMPRLTDLKLELWGGHMSYIHDFFRELEDPDNKFLPQLQHISFLYCDFMLDPTDVEMLARGLSSRWESSDGRVAQIRSFHLELFLPRTTNTAQKLQNVRGSLASLATLATRGMSIYVGTKSTKFI
ncbi:hypothetical protein B0H13DRAFT_2062829 [Mycena leptocephala]|nr:hypothetical protein B0H13DRAFT_2062829 [Mycena leptocephala]